MPSRRSSRYTITTATAALSTAPPMPGPPLPDSVHQTRIPRIKLMAIREASLPYPARRISHSQHVFELLHDYFHGHDREEMLAILLDSKNCIIGLHTISIGSLTLSIVHPRETFKAAVLMNAAGLILAHNHPSGDATPSSEDRTLTARLTQAGDLLGIRVLDHVVVGDNRYVSFADQGWLVPTSSA